MRRPSPHLGEQATVSYHGHRFPPDVVSLSVWLYYRFPLSLRIVEEMLAARGVVVMYGNGAPLGPQIRPDLRAKHSPSPCRVVSCRVVTDDKWHLDEMVVKMNGRLHWLWGAVDQHGMVLDVWCKRAAKRLMRKLLIKQGRAPRVMVTDRLRSYGAANDEIGLTFEHRQQKGLNHRTENSHQPMRVREKVMRRFKSPRQLQRFIAFHGPIANLFMNSRYDTGATTKRTLRPHAFQAWEMATAAKI